MAEDVNRPDSSSQEDSASRSDPSPLPDARRQAGDPEEAARQRETLPDVRPEEVQGELDRPLAGGPPSVYAPRFRALTGGLVGLAVGAVVAAAVALFAPSFQPGPAWSRWMPTETGTAGANQIARHVAPAYRLPTGDQLVLVTAGPPRVGDLLPAKIAVVGGQGGQRTSVVSGKTILYQLCGLGERCAIAKGTPSVQRFLLLRREGLELALYTFRYLGGVDNVVALLPPAPGEKPQNALFFRKSQLEPVLDRPLTSTLPPPPPTVNSVEDAPEAGMVKHLTRGNLFLYSFTQGQDLSAYLVLNHRASAD
ncbi:MAG: hypothetical protein ACJ76S_05885 [Solirubrobacteraceae bacterium]|jgi:hypothetical protein